MDSSVGKLSAEEMFTTDTVSDTNDTKEKRDNAVAYSLLNDPSTRLTEIVTASGLM